MSESSRRLGVRDTGSSDDAIDVGQEADLGEDSDEAHSQQAKEF